jgi:hypothetical protein
VKGLRLEDKIKELIKVVEVLEELLIRIISLVGWVIILIKILTP